MEEETDYIIHKVQAGYTYIVFRNEHNGNVFYKIGIEQKTLDGQKIRGYMPVRFNSEIELPDKTKIKIKKGIENFYFAKNDTKHYNPVFYIQIIEFENMSEIIDDYNEDINNTNEDDLPF